MVLYFKGLVVGFAIAAPVGPIGILCITRTLSAGRLMGLVSGLGAAVADALYGCIAVLGLTLVSSFLCEHAYALGLAGGVFLCGLGLRNIFAKPKSNTGEIAPSQLIKAFASTFLLTLTNPLTLISFAAIIASSGMDCTEDDYAGKFVLVAGIFSGSALWWILLSLSVGVFRKRITEASMRWINRIGGALIVGCGLFALIMVAR